MRKISLLLALVLMVSFTATVTMAGPGAEPDPVGGGNEITVTPSPPSHTVRPGDTLWDIARRYKVPLADLLAANRLTPASVLAVGQVVTIPTAGDKAAAAFKPVSGSSSVRYRVQRGNTLWDIAIAYGVTVESVMKANRLNKDSILAVGQELTIPRPQRTPVAGELAPPAPPSAPIQAAAPLTVTQVVSETARKARGAPACLRKHHCPCEDRAGRGLDQRPRVISPNFLMSSRASGGTSLGTIICTVP